jgi:hypothetical protein
MKEDEIKALVARASSDIEMGVRRFIDGERDKGHDLIPIMTAIALGMGSSLARTIMRLDMPDGNDPQQSVKDYADLLVATAQETIPNTSEWNRYRDRFGRKE